MTNTKKEKIDEKSIKNDTSIDNSEVIKPSIEKVKKEIEKDNQVFDISNVQSTETKPKKEEKQKKPRKTNPKSLDNLRNVGTKKKETKPKKKESIPIIQKKEETKNPFWKSPAFWVGVAAAGTGIMFLFWKIQQMRKNKQPEKPELPQSNAEIQSNEVSEQEFLE